MLLLPSFISDIFEKVTIFYLVMFYLLYMYVDYMYRILYILLATAKLFEKYVVRSLSVTREILLFFFFF